MKTKAKILILVLLLCTTLVSSCQNSEPFKRVKGDIYIKLVDSGSLYPLSNKEIVKTLESINNDELLTYYKSLEKNNLLDKPYFNLKTEEGEVIKIFTKLEAYNKLSNYIENLNRENEKVEVDLMVKKINLELGEIYFSNKINSIIKKKGKTDWSK